MGSTLFAISQVNKTFGGLRALTNVNLHVEEGTTHAIIGPNGAGKSTLLNVCIGLLPPDPGSGRVTFDGTVLTGKKAHEINQLGVVRVFQTPQIFDDLSLLHNLMVPAFSKRDGAFKLNLLRNLRNEQAIEHDAGQVLTQLGLRDKAHHHAGSLSRGDKRRLELGMGLIQKPKLLLLDEPTAGMARHDTNRTIELLKSFPMTKVIIEHDMHVVFSLADKISVLSQGCIIAEGAPDDIRGNPKVKEAYLGGAHV